MAIKLNSDIFYDETHPKIKEIKKNLDLAEYSATAVETDIYVVSGEYYEYGNCGDIEEDICQPLDEVIDTIYNTSVNIELVAQGLDTVVQQAVLIENEGVDFEAAMKEGGYFEPQKRNFFIAAGADILQAGANIFFGLVKMAEGVQDAAVTLFGGGESDLVRTDNLALFQYEWYHSKVGRWANENTAYKLKKGGTFSEIIQGVTYWVGGFRSKLPTWALMGAAGAGNDYASYTNDRNYVAIDGGAGKPIKLTYYDLKTLIGLEDGESFISENDQIKYSLKDDVYTAHYANGEDVHFIRNDIVDGATQNENAGIHAVLTGAKDALLAKGFEMSGSIKTLAGRMLANGTLLAADVPAEAAIDTAAGDETFSENFAAHGGTQAMKQNFVIGAAGTAAFEAGEKALSTARNAIRDAFTPKPGAEIPTVEGELIDPTTGKVLDAKVGEPTSGEVASGEGRGLTAEASAAEAPKGEVKAEGAAPKGEVKGEPAAEEIRAAESPEEFAARRAAEASAAEAPKGEVKAEGAAPKGEVKGEPAAEEIRAAESPEEFAARRAAEASAAEAPKGEAKAEAEAPKVETSSGEIKLPEGLKSDFFEANPNAEIQSIKRLDPSRVRVRYMDPATRTFKTIEVSVDPTTGGKGLELPEGLRAYSISNPNLEIVSIEKLGSTARVTYVDKVTGKVSTQNINPNAVQKPYYTDSVTGEQHMTHEGAATSKITTEGGETTTTFEIEGNPVDIPAEKFAESIKTENPTADVKVDGSKVTTTTTNPDAGRTTVTTTDLTTGKITITTTGPAEFTPTLPSGVTTSTATGSTATPAGFALKGVTEGINPDPEYVPTEEEMIQAIADNSAANGYATTPPTTSGDTSTGTTSNGDNSSGNTSGDTSAGTTGDNSSGDHSGGYTGGGWNGGSSTPDVTTGTTNPDTPEETTPTTEEPTGETPSDSSSSGSSGGTNTIYVSNVPSSGSVETTELTPEEELEDLEDMTLEDELIDDIDLSEINTDNNTELSGNFTNENKHKDNSTAKKVLAGLGIASTVAGAAGAATTYYKNKKEEEEYYDNEFNSEEEDEEEDDEFEV